MQLASWMWLLPSGYGYALEAGSIMNDMFGAVLTLTAFEYALRARKTNPCRHFTHSTGEMTKEATTAPRPYTPSQGASTASGPSTWL